MGIEHKSYLSPCGCSTIYGHHSIPMSWVLSLLAATPISKKFERRLSEPQFIASYWELAGYLQHVIDIK